MVSAGSNQCTLFMGQLHRTQTTKEKLRQHLEGKLGNGTIGKVRLLTDKETGLFRGMAFVDLPAKFLEDALELHHSTFCGQRINVEQTASGSKTRRQEVVGQLREKQKKDG